MSRLDQCWILSAGAIALTAGCAQLSTGPGTNELAVKPVYRFNEPAGTAAGQYAVGRLDLAEGRINSAILRFQKALRLDQGFVDAHNGLGVAYGQLGRYDDAIASFRAALAITPKASHLLNNLGYAELKAGRLFDSKASLVRALEMDPDNAGTKANLKRTETLIAAAEAAAPKSGKSRDTAKAAVTGVAADSAKSVAKMATSPADVEKVLASRAAPSPVAQSTASMPIASKPIASKPTAPIASPLAALKSASATNAVQPADSSARVTKSTQSSSLEASAQTTKEQSVESRGPTAREISASGSADTAKSKGSAHSQSAAAKPTAVAPSAVAPAVAARPVAADQAVAGTELALPEATTKEISAQTAGAAVLGGGSASPETALATVLAQLSSPGAAQTVARLVAIEPVGKASPKEGKEIVEQAAPLGVREIAPRRVASVGVEPNALAVRTSSAKRADADRRNAQARALIKDFEAYEIVQAPSTSQAIVQVAPNIFELRDQSTIAKAKPAYQAVSVSRAPDVSASTVVPKVALAAAPRKSVVGVVRQSAVKPTPLQPLKVGAATRHQMTASITRSTPPKSVESPVRARKVKVDYGGIEVMNASGIGGLAERWSDTLRRRGADIVSVTQGGKSAHTSTTIYYRRGFSADARHLADQLGSVKARMVQSNALSGEVDIRLVLGRDAQRRLIVRQDRMPQARPLASGVRIRIGGFVV